MLSFGDERQKPVAGFMKVDIIGRKHRLRVAPVRLDVLQPARDPVVRSELRPFDLPVQYSAKFRLNSYRGNWV